MWRKMCLQLHCQCGPLLSCRLRSLSSFWWKSLEATSCVTFSYIKSEGMFIDSASCESLRLSKQSEDNIFSLMRLWKWGSFYPHSACKLLWGGCCVKKKKKSDTNISESQRGKKRERQPKALTVALPRRMFTAPSSLDSDSVQSSSFSTFFNIMPVGKAAPLLPYSFIN